MKERGAISPLPLPDLQALNVDDMPDWITGAAQEVWHSIIPQALEAGLPRTVLDRDVVAVYASSMGRLIKSERLISSEGLYLPVTGAIRIREHPAVKVIDRYRRIASALADKLGLAPMSRTRMTLLDRSEPEENPWAQFR
jgi:P27 family predicted phage terminase small subunit